MESEIKEFKYFAGGQWRRAEGDRTFDVHEPYSGKIFAGRPPGRVPDARIAVDAARGGFSGMGGNASGRESASFFEGSRNSQTPASSGAETLARETGSTISFSTFQMDLVAATLQQVAGWVYLPKGEVLETNLAGTHFYRIAAAVRRFAQGFTPWNGANILSWRARGIASCRGEHRGRQAVPNLRRFRQESLLRRLGGSGFPRVSSTSLLTNPEPRRP